VPDLLEDILRAVIILLLALTVFKGVLDWNIGPLLASTALLTAVLGFALQGVLGNLLAGMSLHLTRTVMQGDWVDVNGTEGRVKRTNWRETRLTTIGGHELIVPNSIVAGSVVHNLTMPNPIRRHTVEVGASYGDAPDDVIAALIASAREVPDVLASPAPNALVTAFADYGINYRLYFSTRQYHRRRLIDGQVCRHIWYKFKRAGIEIPFPMSDKLLNDFMTVVYNQRKLEPQAADQAAIVRDLLASDLHTKLFVDEGGNPLLSRDDYERLAPMVRRELYTLGETIMRQGEPGRSLHVLVKGEMNGRMEGAQDRSEVAFTVHPGAVIGEMSLLTGEPRSATVTTATGCEVLTLDHEGFVALLKLREELPDKLADLAAARLAANRQAADQARQSLAACPVHRQERTGILKRLLGFLSH
jgi:CRP-like cAMP-binding protein